MIATGVMIALWLGFYLWYYLTYNHFVALENTVAQAWAHVDVELQRRYDLIGNLVEVVKGYARHEAETLQKTVMARSEKKSTVSVNDANQNNQHVVTVLSNIMVLVEQYPQLKADQQFQHLQLALIETENRIATRRSAYNHCVSRYEIQRHSFPALVIAWAGKFGKTEFFDAQEASATAIRVAVS